MRRGCTSLILAAIVALWNGSQLMAFDLQGHRGARGLLPENTLLGFARALEIGVTTLETDLAVTRDGILVLSHDPVLNPDIARGPDGAWLAAPGPAIHSLTLAELGRYDVGRIRPDSKYAKTFPAQVPSDGQRIPTLAQLFDLAGASGKSPRFNVETKLSPDKPDETPGAETFARLVVEAIRSAKLEARVTIQSFDWRTLLVGKAAGARDRDGLPHVREDARGPHRGRHAQGLAVAGGARSGQLRRLRAAPRRSDGLRDVVPLFQGAECGCCRGGPGARPEGGAVDRQHARGHRRHHRHEGRRAHQRLPRPRP